MAKSPTVRWTTELSAFGNNTGIVVPPELIEQLGQGKRPAVAATVNGYAFRTTVGVMGGQHLVSISAAIRKETGLAAGDAIDVTLTADASPRTVDVPADLAAALAESGVRPFFDALSNSLQRYHVDNVNGAKSDDTRRRRVEKAIELFTAGKQR
jgi:antitoxin component of MazEF toxin-antitoxin module